MRHFGRIRFLSRSYTTRALASILHRQDSVTIMSGHHFKFAEHENFCTALKNGYLPTVEDHFRKPGSEVNMVVDAGRNALHIATEARRFNIMNYLLRSGANPLAEDDTGETPLYIAISSGEKEAVKLLLEYGADPTGKSPDDEPYVDISKDNAEIQAMVKKAIKEW